MQIYQRTPGGVWYVRWTDEHGRTRRTSSRSKDRHTAEKLGVRLEERGINKTEIAISLASFFGNDYVDLVQNKTLRDDIARFERHIRPYMGSISVRLIGTMHCQRLQAKLQRDLSNATVNRVMSLLSAIISRAIHWEVRQGPNPCHGVKALREGPSPRKILTPLDETKLYSQCSPQVHCFVMMALNTGLRRGELLGLRWSDIETYDKEGPLWINLKDTKTGSPRKVPCNKKVIRALQGLGDPADPHALVFFGWGHSINMAISKACERAGIPHYRIHDFRHTFCTRLARKGVDVATIMKLAGHKKLSTTLLYLEPRSGREAVDLLA
jgi:integrase